MAITTRRRGVGGRPTKGDRVFLATRVPPELRTAIRARAAAADMTVSDYIGSLLAQAHGMPEAVPPAQQEQLPLGA